MREHKPPEQRSPCSAANRDTGVVDTNRDGAAEWNSYGPTNNGLNVGETRADGIDLRYVVPFTL